MRLKTKLPSLVGYADRPLLRGLATTRAAGLDLDKGGGVSQFAFTFDGQPFTFGGLAFTYGAP